MDAVSKGSSIKGAAENYGVPRTTLQDRVSGYVQHGKKPGPLPYLNKEEEEDLVKFVEVVADVGFGKTRKQIKAMVEQTARDKQILKKEKISDGWFRRFLERQPHLTLRKGDRTAAVRMNAMKNTSALDNYFILLKSILYDNNLQDKPGQIYNMDESGIPLDHRSPCVLARKGQKKVRYSSTGNKSQITVVGCINAIGQALPPFIVFDAKHLNMQWAVGEVPGTTFGLSDSGWMDMILFKKWFLKHFLCHVGSGRPVLLLMDGHSSHYNIEAVTLARTNDVILFTLVPHTTHEMQPLDTAVFAPLKTHWQDSCHCYLQSHPGTLITKYQFNQVFSEAWLKAMVPANIISGFKSCGIYPFNPKAILDHDPCAAKDKVSESNDSSEQLGVSTPAVERAEGTSGESNEVTTTESFTAEEEILYNTRYAEGYNVHDPKYISWLNINHPDENYGTFLPLIEHFPDSDVPEEIPVSVDPSTTDNLPLESNNQMLEPGSISDEVLPGSTPSRKDSASSNSVSRSLVMETPVTTESVSTASTTPHTAMLHSNSSTPLSNNNSTNSSVCTSPTNSISKYLVQYVPAVVEKKKAAETRVTGSRVLTSAEGLAMLREKEEKKQKEKEEKEKRKQERLKKKKEKDDLAKKKAEEKAKKVAEKGKAPSRQKRVSRSKSLPSTDSQIIDGPGSSVSTTESSTVTDRSEPSDSTTGSTVSQFCPDDDYECSECLGTYSEDIVIGNGAEWIQCGCGQWIHEDCIVNTMIGSDGTERMCSNCVL